MGGQVCVERRVGGLNVNQGRRGWQLGSSPRARPTASLAASGRQTERRARQPERRRRAPRPWRWRRRRRVSPRTCRRQCCRQIRQRGARSPRRNCGMATEGQRKGNGRATEGRGRSVVSRGRQWTGSGSPWTGSGRAIEGRGSMWKAVGGRGRAMEGLVEGHGRSWKAMEGHGRPWKVVECRGRPWKSVELRGSPWKGSWPRHSSPVEGQGDGRVRGQRGDEGACHVG